MIEIPLTQGKVALISDHRYELVSQYKWYAVKNHKTYYAGTHIPHPDGGWYTPPNGRRQRCQAILFLHQLITGLKGADHRDRNGLNCQDENLRPADSSQQIANQDIRVNNQSGFIGVSWDRCIGRWRAQVRKNGHRIYGKYFDNPVDAAFARDAAARAAFGEFANFNFVFGPDSLIPEEFTSDDLCPGGQEVSTEK